MFSCVTCVITSPQKLLPRTFVSAEGGVLMINGAPMSLSSSTLFALRCASHVAQPHLQLGLQNVCCPLCVGDRPQMALGY